MVKFKYLTVLRHNILKKTENKGEEAMEERNNRLLNAKLNKYIVPGIMMSLALQLGNIVDTIFVK